MANKKHNKLKNVGVLFELLTRQITNDTLSSSKKSPAINIVKEHFQKNSMLFKEYNLYKVLQHQKYIKEGKADKFVDIVMNEHNKLNRSKLKREKYNLIKEIKKNYNLDDFFKSRVSNYKLNASIHTLFESKYSKKVLNPTTLTTCRYYIVNHILGENSKNKKNTEHIIKEFSKNDKDLRILSYKILLEKFNDKYGKLNNKQRNLLKEYINNISNNSTLKTYIVSEISTINKALTLLGKKVDNKIVKIKLTEVQQQLNLIKEDSKIRDKHLVSLLRSYNLISELNNVVK
jgi:hypothetical protein